MIQLSGGRKASRAACYQSRNGCGAPDVAAHAFSAPRRRHELAACAVIKKHYFLEDFIE